MGGRRGTVDDVQPSSDQPETDQPETDQPQADPSQPDPAQAAPHPLAKLITEAAEGRFPDVNGGWHRVPPWHPGPEAVFAFTGHAVLAIADDIPDADLIAAGVDGFGGAHDPRLIAGLAGADGWIDSLDAVLVGRGTKPGTGTDEPATLGARPDLSDHPRVRHAAAIRSQLRVLGYPDPARSAVVILSSGLAGLTELSFELEPDRRRSGEGIALVRDALATIPAGERVVACAAPGNAASLRALITVGFVPIGSVQLFRRDPAPNLA
jgi:hypothetical protein